MTTLFISDLHLDARRPAVTDLFLDFLHEQARTAQALYILGDLFEAWIGDDDDSLLGRETAAGLKRLADHGVPVYFIHGNRDFLIGEGFAAASGIEILPEATVIDLYDTPTLIMHGDTLCTDDVEYQALRARFRSPQWQAQMLALPLAQRRILAKQLRDGSQEAIQQKASDITDVNAAAVAQAMQTHGVKQLIHGHTHRPAVHTFTLDGQTARRIVLGDWYEQGSMLYCDAHDCRLQILKLDESV